MADYKLTKYEQETHILFSEDGPWASLDTTSPSVAQRLLKAGYKGSQDGPTWSFRIPKSLVRLRGKGWPSARVAGVTATPEPGEGLEVPASEQ